MVTGNEVSSWLAAAYGDGTFLAGASLDTRKCFDSVSLLSLRVLLRGAGAPFCMFNVLNIWQSLTRHVWTIDGPTGVTIKATVQKGLPQGDPLAPWALNLVMAAWVWSLPKLDLLRVSWMTGASCIKMWARSHQRFVARQSSMQLLV